MGKVYKQSFRIFEQFENIAVNGAVDAGDLISKEYTKLLVQSDLVRKDHNGKYVLTGHGHAFWNYRWRSLFEKLNA